MTVDKPSQSAPQPHPATTEGSYVRRSRPMLIVAALLVLAGDLASKVAASAWLRDGPVELPGPVDLQLFHNPGVAFGLGSNLPPWSVLAVTTAVAALVAVELTRDLGHGLL